MSFQEKLLDIMLYSLTLFESFIDKKDKKVFLLLIPFLQKNPNMFLVDQKAEHLLLQLEKHIIMEKKKDEQSISKNLVRELKSLINHLFNLPLFPKFVHNNRYPHHKQLLKEHLLLNDKVRYIKEKNHSFVMNQIVDKHLVENILQGALKARSDSIVLVDGANTFFRLFGRHMSIKKITDPLIKAIKKDAGIQDNKHSIFWVILNQGSLNEKGQWTTVLDSSKGMIINVACVINETDCFRQPNIPNPMDDLAILVIAEALKRLINYYSQKHPSLKLVYPSVFILSRDQFRDFRLIL